MNPTILVTGGAGYIGSHTVVELQQAGFGVVVLDNLSNSSRESLARVERLAGRAVEFVEGDVRDALDAAGVSYDRTPFVPHLTVARGVRVPAEPIEPIVTHGWRAALACSAQRKDAQAPGRYRIAAWVS